MQRLSVKHGASPARFGIIRRAATRGESGDNFRYARLWWLIGAALIVAIVILSLIPDPLDTEIKEGDKLAHLLAYGSLMFWFGMLAATARARFAWAIAFAALGVALEYAQGLTGYRTFDVVDMAANAAGVVIGWGVAVTPAGRLLAWFERRISAPSP